MNTFHSISCAIIHQLTRNLTPEEIATSGFDKYYVDHTLTLWPQAASGKARTTYDNILRLVKDPKVCDPVRFLREREIVHFQRFGEGLNVVKEHLDSKNFYAFNPEFDIRQKA